MTQEGGKTVWVFSGGGQFPAGIFETREQAEEWIALHRLTGLLTLYPLGESSYDWAVRNGYFNPKRPEQTTPEYIARFTSGHEHYHYEDGAQPCGDSCETGED